MKFGEILKSLRIAHKYTQEELAKELKIASSTVSMYERGERTPDYEMLEVIADFFQVDMNYLHARSPENKERKTREPEEIGRIVRELRGSVSLREFAKKCDISHTTIDNIEKGVDFRTGKPTQVKITTLQKIASACGVSITYIIGDASEAIEYTDILPKDAEEKENDAKRELLNRIGQMDDDQLKQLSDYADYLIDKKKN